MLLKDSAILSIPDHKWHFFEKSYRAFLRGNITSSTPVLRACAVYQVAEIYYYRGQPRTELLLLFQHVKGEHLVNITLDDNKFYVNRKFYTRVRWALEDTHTSVVLEKNEELNRIWAEAETMKKFLFGNGTATTSKIPWVYHNVATPVPSRVNGRTSYSCSEVKIKVVDGYVDYHIKWAEIGFPSEPYDDIFFTTTTTTTATTTATTRSQDHTDFETTTPEAVTNKASLTMGLIFVIGGILVMAAAGVLFFVGFRLGQCHTLKYVILLEDSAVLSIPDNKWHFFINKGQTLRGNITTSTPVLRACSVYEVFEAYYFKGQPRTELLLLFQHVKGDHLFNLTLANDNFYVNGKLYIHLRWALQGVRTSVVLEKSKVLSRVWALHETYKKFSLGNGNTTTPKIPWIYHSVPNPVPSRANGRTSYPCSEVKIKVVDGYVEYRVAWETMGFPTEPYDDTFFTTSTTTSATTQSQSHTDFKTTPTTPAETTTNKASLSVGILFAIGGVLVMVAAGVLFFVGFRLGQCRGNITTSTPVLRACFVNEVFTVFYYKSQPRTELLLLFQHEKGEHLFNLTLANDKLYVNKKFYIKLRWVLLNNRTSVLLDKKKERSRVWALHETYKKLSLGNGNVTTPKIPWVFHSVPKISSRGNGPTSYPCSEVKIKVVDGYVEYRISWLSTGFPSEPYDDIFFTTTTTTMATTQSQDHTDLKTTPTTPSETVTNKASLSIGILFAIGGVLVMVAAGVLSFVGFRLVFPNLMVWICNYVLLILLCNSYALKYIAFPIDTTEMSVIPDKKFNFCKSANEGFECKIKPSTPMLQLCAKVEIFKVIFFRGQPRAVLLLKFKHVMGEHLFNLTYVNEYIYVNGEFYVKLKWKQDKEKAQIRLKKGRHGAYVLATDATERRSIGNGGISSPEHEWVLDTVLMKRNSEIDNCSVVKIKVVEGFVHYRMLWPYAGFATELYDDEAFTTTPPSITVLGEKKRRRKKLLSDSTESFKKASLLPVVFYVIAGVLVLVATPVLFFIGFRLGKCYAEKTALKKRVVNAVENIRKTETDNKQEASSKPSEKASSLKEMPTPVSETDKR